MICLGWNCHCNFTCFCATVGKITLWKHYVAIYHEQNKCICEDVNAVMNEWWILEVLVGLRTVCCTSFPHNSFHSVPTLHQSTPGKSPEAIYLHSLSQRYFGAGSDQHISVPMNTNQWGNEWQRERKSERERQKFKIQ